MKQAVTQAIVLSRTNFGEADRIITVLTPDYGKLRLMVKGARKVKSKLAGGIELFSVSDLTFIEGRGEIKTLVSSRLRQHFEKIVKDIDRTMLGYEILKMINKLTEDNTDKEYFDLLKATIEGLNDNTLKPESLTLWLDMRLLSLAGHAPNLHTDTQGISLQPDQKFTFDYEAMAFEASPRGHYDSRQIKLLRLASQADDPKIFTQLKDANQQIKQAANLSHKLLTQQLGV